MHPYNPAAYLGEKRILPGGSQQARAVGGGNHSMVLNHLSPIPLEPLLGAGGSSGKTHRV